MYNFISYLDSPNRNVEQVALDTNKDLFKAKNLIESEFDKATRTNEELNHKVNELTYGVSMINYRMDSFDQKSNDRMGSFDQKINDRMDSFDQKINQIIELLNK